MYFGLGLVMIGIFLGLRRFGVMVRIELFLSLRLIKNRVLSRLGIRSRVLAALGLRGLACSWGRV